MERYDYFGKADVHRFTYQVIVIDDGGRGRCPDTTNAFV
jgi:hypothetical protein